MAILEGAAVILPFFNFWMVGIVVGITKLSQ